MLEARAPLHHRIEGSLRLGIGAAGVLARLFGPHRFIPSRHEALLAGHGVTTSKGMAGNAPRGLRR